MYTKQIQFKKYLPQYDVWVDQTLRVVDDSIWLHLQAMSLDKHIKQVVVKDIK